jgi:hemerythrin-like metal-binding protein
MTLINWNESFSVSVREIDEQHKKLADMLNELDQARREGDEKAVLKRILVESVTYATTHFRTEEKYFAQFGYPDTQNHKREHANFLKRTALFIEEFESGKKELTADVMDFLGEWWRDHILGADKRYSRFFNENGLT